MIGQKQDDDDDDDTTPFEGGRENIFVRLTDFHSSFHDLWAYLYLLCVSKLLCNFGEQIHPLRLFKTLPTKLPSFESNRSVVIIQIQSRHKGFNGTSILFIAKAFICFHASAQKPSSTVEVEGSSY